MKVALVDPSNFTLPYDNLLGIGLTRNNCRVTLLKRRNRANELVIDDRLESVEEFYRVSESHKSILTKTGLFSVVKAFEHIADMRAFRGKAAWHRFDILHFQWLVVPWVDQRLLRRTFAEFPTVVTVHDSKLYHGVGKTRIQAAGWLNSLRAFDHVIVHTEMSRRTVEESGVDGERITVIPHGIIPIDGYGRMSKSISANESNRTAKLRFLMFGFLKSYKGLDTLADALISLDDSILDNISVTLAGKPHEEVEEVLKKFQYGRLKRISRLDLRFLSEQELSEYLGSHDVILFPYHRIDASGAFMASVPFKKIIVASEVGIFAESIENGRTGILVPPKDAASLARAIKNLVTDIQYRKRLLEGAERFCAQIPSWIQIGCQTRAVYNKAIASHEIRMQGREYTMSEVD